MYPTKFEVFTRNVVLAGVIVEEHTAAADRAAFLIEWDALRGNGMGRGLRLETESRVTFVR